MNYKNYKYFHQNSKSGVPERKPEVTSSVANLNNLATSTTRRGNSLSSMNFPNLNNVNNFNPQININEAKSTKGTQAGGLNAPASRTLRKEVIKLYEKNLKNKCQHF